MPRVWSLPAIVLVLLAVDNPQVLPWRTPAPRFPDAFSGKPIVPSPDFGIPQDGAQQTTTPSASSDQAAPGKSGGPLDPSARLTLVRFVDGEFARAVKSIPAGKEGLIVRIGKPFDDTALHRALAMHGAALNPGDRVQITQLEFKSSSIVVQLNGGAAKKWRWRDHVSIGMSGAPAPTATTTTTGPDAGEPAKPGATIFLEFGHNLQEMSPEELKGYLAPVLDFSKQRSAAVEWAKTLPPEVQKAITEKRALVGMNREEVVAAVGKPEKKVREQAADGNETEDWIYGTPPARTMFVTFVGDKVVKIQQFPQ